MRWRCGRCRTRSPIAWSSCGATSNAQVVERRGTSIPDYLDWRDEEPIVRSDVARGRQRSFIMYGSGAPDAGHGESSPDEYFAMLGVEPLLGRDADAGR